MELVQAETFISDQKATSVLDINPLLQKKHELWGKILRRFHNIKEEHMPLIERFLQRAVEEAAAEVAEEENQERKAKMQKVNATEEVSSGDEEVEEEEPKVNEEGSFTGEDLREDAQPFVGEEPIEPGFVKWGSRAIVLVHERLFWSCWDHSRNSPTRDCVFRLKYVARFVSAHNYSDPMSS